MSEVATQGGASQVNDYTSYDNSITTNKYEANQTENNFNYKLITYIKNYLKFNQYLSNPDPKINTAIKTQEDNRGFTYHKLRGLTDDSTVVTVAETDLLYHYALEFIPKNLYVDTKKEPQTSVPSSSSYQAKFKKNEGNYTYFEAGFGLFKLKFREEVIYAIHECIGDPVGSSQGAVLHKLLVFFVPGKENKELISDLLEHIAKENQIRFVSQELIEVWTYNAKWAYWRPFFRNRSRPEKSVVIPNDSKKKLLDDIHEFLSEETKMWYYERGIPYKRSYLFYGVPGSGKTSLISVVAGKYNRPICYLSPTDPDMTDDKLKVAVQDSPENAIIVIEDIDALFTKERQTRMHNFLSFSGLLNALDGVGAGRGQLFILTTNFRNKLDEALIRTGRVDLQIEFGYITREQASEFFTLFYPDCTKEASEKFVQEVFSFGLKISAAMLQNFFITHRKCNFTEILEKLDDLKVEVKNAQTDISIKEGVNTRGKLFFHRSD